ncbi:hypothetical protein P4L29_12135 [Bacillus cereus]|nr:hypothetical protein [Bacillus cereus]
MTYYKLEDKGSGDQVLTALRLLPMLIVTLDKAVLSKGVPVSSIRIIMFITLQINLLK